MVRWGRGTSTLALCRVPAATWLSRPRGWAKAGHHQALGPRIGLENPLPWCWNAEIIHVPQKHWKSQNILIYIYAITIYIYLHMYMYIYTHMYIYIYYSGYKWIEIRKESEPSPPCHQDLSQRCWLATPARGRSGWLAAACHQGTYVTSGRKIGWSWVQP